MRVPVEAGRSRLHTRPVAAGSLLFVTMMWGSTFFMIKVVLDEVSALDFLSLRFVMAAALMSVVFWRRLWQADWLLWKHGLILGLIYAAGQWTQTVGLETCDASVSGFITALNVVLTPVLALVLLRWHTAITTWQAVVVATVGLGILTLRGFSVGYGETLTLVGAVFYALFVVYMSHWSPRHDTLSLATVQMIGIALGCSLAAAPGGVSLPQSGWVWVAIIYMVLLPGIAAIVLQTWAQTILTSGQAAVIMAAEPVFATAFAIAFGGEFLTWRIGLGGALVIVAVLWSELGPGLLALRQQSRSGPGGD